MPFIHLVINFIRKSKSKNANLINFFLSLLLFSVFCWKYLIFAARYMYVLHNTHLLRYVKKQKQKIHFLMIVIVTASPSRKKTYLQICSRVSSSVAVYLLYRFTVKIGEFPGILYEKKIRNSDLSRKINLIPFLMGLIPFKILASCCKLSTAKANILYFLSVNMLITPVIPISTVYTDR